MTHTPGPWRVYRHNKTQRLGIYVGTDENDLEGVIVAFGEPDDWGGVFRGETDVGRDSVSCERGEANANLMAASPDMHAALVKCEEALNLVWEEINLGEKIAPLAYDAIEMARAALVAANQGPTPPTDTTDLKSQSDLIAALAVQLETPK